MSEHLGMWVRTGGGLGKGRRVLVYEVSEDGRVYFRFRYNGAIKSGSMPLQTLVGKHTKEEEGDPL